MPLDWKTLAVSNPERCIDLLEATVFRELDRAGSADADAGAIRTDRRPLASATPSRKSARPQPAHRSTRGTGLRRCSTGY